MLLKKITSTILSLICVSAGYAQVQIYEDYIGAGHSEDILISTSSSYSDPEWTDNSMPKKTLNGEGLDGRKAEAARFLFQAGMGGTEADINQLAKTLDFEGWIDWQMALPKTDMLWLTRQSHQLSSQRLQALNNNSSEFDYNRVHFQYAWWHAAMTRQDILRQRIAYALSEIFVISAYSNIRNDGEGPGSYYDMLMSNAFGNYRELIEDVTYHPAMGVYLSHFRNQKSDSLTNVFPDENYARELLQLFSIGLYELYQNGNIRKDSDNNPIAAYNPEDIRNLSRVFTGFGAGGLTQEGQDAGEDLSFQIHANYLDYTVPMAVYNDYHDEEEKILFGNQIIPASQDGIDDVDMALDYIFQHPNVGPFIARRLIQQLITSNPSPSYIYDVAQVFNDNGDGIRGDLAAVIKSILLHEEARDCLWYENPANGKLKSPVGRYLQFARIFADRESQDYFWTSGFTFEYNTYQRPLASPSVFNFYLPDHQPNGDIRENGLYGPEFEIHNSATSTGYANEVDDWVRKKKVFTIDILDYEVPLQSEGLASMAQDPEVLVNYLDYLLCHGRLSAETRQIVIETLNQVELVPDFLEKRTELAMFLIMISPDYTIQK